MEDRNKNPKTSNRENKKNDLGRPENPRGNKKKISDYQNFLGEEIK